MYLACFGWQSCWWLVFFCFLLVYVSFEFITYIVTILKMVDINISRSAGVDHVLFYLIHKLPEDNIFRYSNSWNHWVMISVWYVVRYYIWWHSSRTACGWLQNILIVSLISNFASDLYCLPGPGAGSKRLGLRTTAAIIFGRLVLVPPAGLGIVTVADKLGFIPKGDKMFKFVLLLQHSMPTSVLSGKMINLNHINRWFF